MTLVLETGAGTPGANSYVSTAFVTSYLQARSREAENDWLSRHESLKSAAAIAATDYIDKRWGPRVRGTALRPVINGRAARGTFQLSGAPSNAETFTLGQVVYRFVAALAQENDVLIGSGAEETIENLRAAIIAGDGRDTVYHEDTRVNFEATASIDEDDASILVPSALMAGENGNGIALATTAALGTVSGATMAGGIDTAAQPLVFPKCDLYTPKGEPVVGVPLKLKQATAEYAVRSLVAELAPDLSVDDRGSRVQSFREKVGPIEEETVYAEGGVPLSFRPYPAADQLLTDYLMPSGGTFR